VARIREFESRANVFQPTNTGARAAAAIGTAKGDATAFMGQKIAEGAQQLGNFVQAQYDQRVVQSELNGGGRKMTGVIAEGDLEWKRRAREAEAGNAHNDQKNFLEEWLEPQLEAFQSGFTSERGKAWSQQSADSIRSHFYNTTLADVETMANVATDDNLKGMVNSISRAAMANPGQSLPFYISSLNAGIDALRESSDLSPGESARLDTMRRDVTRETILADMTGAMDADPDVYLASVDAGDYDQYTEFISGEDLNVMQKRAEAVKSGMEGDARLLSAEARRQQAEFNNGLANKAFTDFVSVGPTGELFIRPGALGAARHLAGVDGMDASIPKSMIGAFNSIQDRQVKGEAEYSTPGLFQDFLTRATLPTDDPNRISISRVMAAVESNDPLNRLSKDDLSQVMQAIGADDPIEAGQNKEIEGWIKAQSAIIAAPDPLTGVYKDATAPRLIDDFSRQVRREIKRRMGAGMGFDEAIRGLIGKGDRLDLEKWSAVTQSRGPVKGTLRDRAVLPALPEVQPLHMPTAPGDMIQPGESLDAYLSRRKAPPAVSPKDDKERVKVPPSTKTQQDFENRFGDRP